MLSSWALHGAAPLSSRPRIARPGLSPQASILVEAALTLAALRRPPPCFLSPFLQTLPMHGAASLALHGAAPSSRRCVGGVLKLVSLAFSVWPREAPKGTLSSSGSGQRVGQAWMSDALVLHGIIVSYFDTSDCRSLAHDQWPLALGNQLSNHTQNRSNHTQNRKI